jgi:hypothetical protein
MGEREEVLQWKLVVMMRVTE